MSHSRTVKHSASRVAVLALAGGGMMIPAAAAMAAPATAWSFAPVIVVYTHLIS